MNSHWLRALLILGLAISLLIFTATAVGKPRRQAITIQQKQEAEQRLFDLGYWTGPVDGNIDATTRQALIAFQKLEGRPRTGKLTINELRAMRAASRPVPYKTGTPHIEIDLDRQVLFVVDASDKVTHILPVSTGNDGTYMDHGELHRARTPRGTFKVQRKIDGWRRSSLGLLYYPSYIVGGIAIHGSNAVEIEPASHGCVRIPMSVAKEFSRMAPVGTQVVVYDNLQEEPV